MGIKYRKEEFKDLAELLVWSSEGRLVFYKGGMDAFAPSCSVVDLKKNYGQGSYEKAIEVKEEILGQLYVCIKDYKVVCPINKQYLVGDTVIANRAEDLFWQRCTMDKKGIVKSVIE